MRRVRTTGKKTIMAAKPPLSRLAIGRIVRDLLAAELSLSR